MTTRNVAVRLSANIQAYQASMQKAKQATTELRNSAGIDLNKLGSSLTDAGKRATLGVTLPIVGVGAAAVKMAGDFDGAMAKIVGLVGLSTEEVDGMKTSVLELAGETAKAPQELADGLFVLTSAGLRGQDAMDALEMSAKASAAGLGATNDIARAVSGVMNAYGSDVVDAAQATDILTATARAGNFETSQLAGSLGRVLPFAEAAEASFEDVGGAIALMTRTNGDAAQSVTNLSGLLKAFATPTKQTVTELGKLGLTSQDVRDSISRDGLVAALQMLNDKAGGNIEVLGRLVGSAEGTSAAMAILNADAETLEGTFGTTADATGMVGEAFGAVADTDAHRMRQAMVDIQTAMIEVGAIVGPIVADIAGGISSMAGAFSDLDPALQKIIIGVAGLGAAAGPALIVLGSLVRNFQTLKTAVAGASVASLATPLGALAVAIGAIGAAWVIASRQSSDAASRMDDQREAAKELRKELERADDPMDVLRGKARDLAADNELLRDAMQELGIGFDDLIDGTGSGGKALFDLIKAMKDTNAAGRATDDEVAGLETTLRDFAGTVYFARTEMGELDAIEANNAETAAAAASATGDLAGATEDSADATDDATDATFDFNAALEDEQERLDDARDALREHIEALQDQVDAHYAAADSAFAVRDAQDSFADAVTTLDETLADSESTMGDIAQAMDGVAEGARDVAEAQVRLAEDTAAMEGSTLSSTEKLDLFNESLLAQVAGLEGPARTALARYIAAVNGIPEEQVTEILALLDQGLVDEAEAAMEFASRTRQTTVHVDADTAEAENDLNWAARNRDATVTLRYASSGAGPVVARGDSITFGDIEGRASGGPVGAGSFYRVNEQGPELYNVGGQTFLMTGDQSGYITPLSNANASVTNSPAAGDIYVHNTFQRWDGDPEQIRRKVVQALRRDGRLNGRRYG